MILKKLTVNKNASLFVAVFLILLYSTLNIILLLHHEPYGDEAQAWLIARDLDLVSIFKQMAYEGSPALWYLLLVPFAKAGFPYVSEFILYLVIAVAAVAVFVLYAPLSRVTKVLFIFSYYMAYEYSIIARSYGLSILLLFSIAALYTKRFEYPLWYSFLVFSLFNTNIHSFFIASSLTLLFAWEFYQNKVQGSKLKIAVLVMCIGGLSSFLQLLWSPDHINSGIITEINPSMPFIAISNALSPWTLFIPGEIGILLRVISVLMFFTIILSINKKPAVLFVLLLSLSGLFYLFVFKFPGAMRHHGLILILIFFALWISRYYNNSPSKFSEITSKITFAKISVIIINVCLALSLLYSLKIQYWEYKYDFSGAKEMADFINGNHLNNYTIIVHQSTGASALLPYLPKKQFWYAGIESYGTFIIYDRKYLSGKAISNLEVISRMEKAFPAKSQLLLLLTHPLDYPELLSYKLLYKADKDVFGYNREQYYLYKPIFYDGSYLDKRNAI